MDFFKALSHEMKVALSALGTAFVTLCSSKALLTILITQPLSVSIPDILPQLIAMGGIGGGLVNITLKKNEQ